MSGVFHLKLSSSNMFLNGDIVRDNSKSVKDYNRLHIQNIRKTHVTIEVLNKDFDVIGRIEGIAESGSINISSESMIKRSGSITMTLMKQLLPSDKSLLWIANRIRVYCGIQDLQSKEEKITHFLLGTFAIQEPSTDIGINDEKISIQLSDLMADMDTKALETKMVFESGTPVHIAINSLMNFVGEFNTDIEFSLLDIPKKMEFEVGKTVSEVLKELRDLYMDFVCYYDLTGKFVYKHLNLQLSGGEPIKWRFSDKHNITTRMSKGYTYANVYNRVVVYGGNDTKSGISPKAESSITDEGSMFHKNKMGEKTKVITNPSYKKVEQCMSHARYELFKSSTFQEQITITCIPIYTLDVGDVIQVPKDDDKNSYDNFIINAISYGLDMASEMTISGYKAYYDNYNSELSDSLKEYRDSANRIMFGIRNYGWLSVAEKNIKKGFGIGMDREKDKPTLSVAFQNRDIGGVTASTTGYTNTTNQTLIIDIMDFGKSVGESGDNGTGKAEYTDRVLAHEMFHAIMNDYVGVDRILMIPDWLKEGMAEFLHGADERVKNLITTNGVLDYTKVEKLVARSIALINDKPFNSDNLDYGASYVAVKYMYKKMVTANKTMKDLMYNFKTLDKNKTTYVHDCIANVVSTDYQFFADNSKLEMQTFFNTDITLNVGQDELDTGSILGSDYTTEYLNAENVMNHLHAEKDILSYQFEVDVKMV